MRLPVGSGYYDQEVFCFKDCYRIEQSITVKRLVIFFIEFSVNKLCEELCKIDAYVNRFRYLKVDIENASLYIIIIIIII